MSQLNRRNLIKSAAVTTFGTALYSFGGFHSSVFAADGATKEKPKAKEGEKKAKAEPKPDVYADAVFVDGPAPAIKKGSFTVVAMPDTQNYFRKTPESFHAQTKWIVDNKKERNIASVLHLGDITNNNLVDQWKLAKAAMERLDGNVPYFFTLGNHDYSENGKSTDRTTKFNEYFPLKKYKETAHFGGVYDNEPEQYENNYSTFEAGDRKFIVLSLEFGPRKDVVRWGNDVLGKHKDREAILITHAYMYYDETRYDWKKNGGKQSWNPHNYEVAKNTSQDIHDGEELWQNLVKNNNVIMTLNGHVIGDGLGRLTSKNDAGKSCHQMLVNFQMKPNGGDGWMRLLEFSADGKTVDVVDYSPTRNQCNVSSQNKFTLTG